MTGKRFKQRDIRLGDLKNDRPIDPLFVEGLLAYYENPDAYEVRAVIARTIRIPEGHEPAPEYLAIKKATFATVRARQEHPDTPPITVLETADGRLWTYDDVHTVAAYHDLAPTAMLRVVMIGRDETPIPNA